MSFSSLNAGEMVKDVRFSQETLIVDLMDGRTISAPLAWYPLLHRASPAQRKKMDNLRGRLRYSLGRSR